MYCVVCLLVCESGCMLVSMAMCMGMHIGYGVWSMEMYINTNTQLIELAYILVLFPYSGDA